MGKRLKERLRLFSKSLASSVYRLCRSVTSTISDLFPNIRMAKRWETSANGRGLKAREGNTQPRGKKKRGIPERSLGGRAATGHEGYPNGETTNNRSSPQSARCRLPPIPGGGVRKGPYRGEPSGRSVGGGVARRGGS